MFQSVVPAPVPPSPSARERAERRAILLLVWCGIMAALTVVVHAAYGWIGALVFAVLALLFLCSSLDSPSHDGLGGGGGGGGCGGGGGGGGAGGCGGGEGC